MALAKFSITELGNHTDALVLEKESFLYGATQYVGVQHDGWQDDEQNWGFDTNGRYKGATPIRTVPRLMTVPGATTTLDSATQDIVYGVAVATPFSVTFNLLDLAGLSFPAAFELYAYKAADNTAAAHVTVTQPGLTARGSDGSSYFTDVLTTINVSGLAAGSYYLMARLSNGQKLYRLPADYTPNLAYQYLENGTPYVYDPYYNIGRLPADLSSPLRAQRAQILADNAQTDKPQWADYLVDGANPNSTGDWSVIKLQVGSGTWTRGVGLYAAPLRALESVVGGVFSSVAFDPCAVDVSASCVRADGTLLVAGNRISASGPELALWGFDGTAWTLLGKNTNRSNGWCQCSLKDHGATDVRELIYKDGAGVTQTLVYVLSRCSLHVYNPHGDTVNDRLPGVPRSTDGEPGGEALRFFYSQAPVALFTTEGTDDGPLDISNPDFIHYYNQVLAVVGEKQSFMQGTVYNGPNALEEWNGQVVGVLGDKPYSDPTARQYLCALDNSGGWRKVSPRGFLASAYRFQHLIRCGPRLIMVGKAAASENAVCVILENGVFQEYQLDYRIRRMTRSLDADGLETITAIAALPGTDTSLTPRRLIQFTGERVCVDVVYDNTDRFTANSSDFAAAGIAVADLPAYLSNYDPIAEAWMATGVAPASGPYLQKVITGSTISYVIENGPLPYSVGLWGKLHTCTGPDFGLKWKRESACTDADCAGSGGDGDYSYQVIHRDNFAAPWTALQISDVDPNRSLSAAFAAAPILWLRRDSVAAQDDLSSYTERIPIIDGIYQLSQAAKSSIDIVILKPTGSGAFHFKVDPVVI